MTTSCVPAMPRPRSSVAHILPQLGRGIRIDARQRPVLLQRRGGVAEGQVGLSEGETRVGVVRPETQRFGEGLGRLPVPAEARARLSEEKPGRLRLRPKTRRLL